MTAVQTERNSPVNHVGYALACARDARMRFQGLCEVVRHVPSSGTLVAQNLSCRLRPRWQSRCLNVGSTLQWWSKRLLSMPLWHHARNCASLPKFAGTQHGKRELGHRLHGEQNWVRALTAVVQLWASGPMLIKQWPNGPFSGRLAGRCSRCAII